MSAPAPHGGGGVVRRSIQLVSLLVVTAVIFGAAWLVPRSEVDTRIAVSASVGLLLLAGVLCSEVLEVVRLPHLTGYLLAGVLAGPHVLGLVDAQAVHDMSAVNALALALIALAGGAELRVEALWRSMRTLVWATLAHSVVGVVACGGAFLVMIALWPSGGIDTLRLMVAAAILWGVLSISRSPSATLGILAQTRARGPITDYSLAFVMSSDIVVLVIMAIAFLGVRPLVDPAASVSFGALQALGRELLGSVSVGTTLGLALGLYLRVVGRHLLIVLVLLGFGFTEGTHYLHIEPMLTLLVAGFVVENVLGEGERLLEAVSQTGAVVFVVFFATAGAHLDLPQLVSLWPIALALVVTRAVATWGSQRLSSWLAGDEPVLRRWGFAPLISQAGLTLGMGVVISREFPALGATLSALIIATVALNELVGPVLFKAALDLTGESRGAAGAHEGPAHGSASGPPDTHAAPGAGGSEGADHGGAGDHGGVDAPRAPDAPVMPPAPAGADAGAGKAQAPSETEPDGATEGVPSGRAPTLPDPPTAGPGTASGSDGSGAVGSTTTDAPIRPGTT